MSLNNFAVMKRVFPIIVLLSASTIFISDRVSVKASNYQDQTASLTTGTTIGLPLNKKVYLLTTNNIIYQFTTGSTSYGKLTKVKGLTNGVLIGIDFRPSDGKLYGLTDTGEIYTIDTTGTYSYLATKVSSLSPRFPGGFQSLFDFNPVVDAVRMIASNTANYAAVNANGASLSVTAVQAPLTYAAGDTSTSTTPNIAGGSYTNNVKGAASTLFYGLDFDQDTLVTIADKVANGSSNTGGGKIQTIGSLIDKDGKKINISPTADLDIFTDANGTNFLVGISGTIVFSIDLSQIDPNQQLGTTKDITARGILIPICRYGIPIPGNFIDIAIPTN